MFPGTRPDTDKDAITEAMGAEGYFFATMVYLVDDPNHNFGLLPECSGMYIVYIIILHVDSKISLQVLLQADPVWTLV